MTRLPHPGNWRPRPLTTVLVAGIFIAGGVYSAVQAAVSLSRGNVLSAIHSVGLSVFALCFIATALMTNRRSRSLHAAWTTAGTTVFPDRAAVAVLVVALIGGASGSGMYLVLGATGRSDLPFSSNRVAVNMFYMSILCFFAVGGLAAIARRRGTGHLRLTPAGFEIVTASRTRNGSWSEVADITDTAEGTPSRAPIAFVMSDGAQIVLRNAEGYAPRGAALYWMVRHYWQHPEDRGELTDGRALDRLRNEQFIPE